MRSEMADSLFHLIFVEREVLLLQAVYNPALAVGNRHRNDHKIGVHADLCGVSVCTPRRGGA